MFQLVTERTRLDEARDLLASALGRQGTAHRQTISTPGGTLDDALVMSRPDLGIWGHIGTTPVNGSRYYCGFGIGEPSWQTAIEINIPTARLMSCNGQIVEDEDGSLFLAHKGGLGGGKYSVQRAHFVNLIRGFEREPVQDGNEELQLYVLGQLSNEELPERLPAYVEEANRIRELRREEAGYGSALKSVGLPPDPGVQDSGLVLENDKDGVYTIERQIEFRRLHAVVQKALAKRLAAANLKPKTKRLAGNIAPDLFLCDERGEMTVLFEIKVPMGSQSTFTAIGQLLVYGANQPKAPRAILVSRSKPAGKLFAASLAKHAIEHLQYTLSEDGVTFENLETLGLI